MKLFLWCGVFICVLASVDVWANRLSKVEGIGISDSDGGSEFNRNMALTRANDFIGEQAHVSSFTYSKNAKTVQFEKSRSGEIKGVEIFQTIKFGKSGLAILVSADIQPPKFTGRHCKDVVKQIENEEDMELLLYKINQESIIKLIEQYYKKRDKVQGESFMKNLKITTLSKKPVFKIKATVCIGNL